MKVFVEIFYAGVVDEKIVFKRELHEITQGDPDRFVLHRAKESLGLQHEDIVSHSIIHSTSWRYEIEGIFLTYIVFCSAKIQRLEHPMVIGRDDLVLVHGETYQPRPVVIEWHNVLAHGLRHIAFMLRDKPEMKRVLLSTDVVFLTRLHPLLAGEIE